MSLSHHPYSSRLPPQLHTVPNTGVKGVTLCRYSATVTPLSYGLLVGVRVRGDGWASLAHYLQAIACSSCCLAGVHCHRVTVHASSAGATTSSVTTTPAVGLLR